MSSNKQVKKTVNGQTTWLILFDSFIFFNYQKLKIKKKRFSFVTVPII